MFDNAPILTIDPNNIVAMNSVNGILKMRKRYNGTIIVLIEDFDMCISKAKEIENIQLDDEREEKEKIIIRMLYFSY